MNGIFMHISKNRKVSENEGENKLKHVYVYGELLGGYYPHEKVVEKGNKEFLVQSGIYYSPTIEFYAFDIAEEMENGKHSFLDYEKSLEIFKLFKLPHAIPLFVGSFEKCCDFQIEFDSIIGEKVFGLPKITNNKAEGIVIKPMKEILITSKKGKETRPILKMKIEEFSEKKYDEAKKIDNKKFSVSDSKREMLEYEILALVTHNRMVNALSKIGNIQIHEKKKIRKLLKEFKNDVLEQLKEDNESAMKEIDVVDMMELKEIVDKECKKVIVKFFKKKKK